MTSEVTAYIGMGANLGDARATVAAAMNSVEQLTQTQISARSPLYGSAPLGENADGPEYVNAVLAVRTELSASQLLHALQGIELQFGRARSYRNAPRTLDLDLLLYGDVVMDTPELTLPHPRMHERAFVLRPLFDIASECLWHNARGEVLSVRGLLPSVAQQDLYLLENPL